MTEKQKLFAENYLAKELHLTRAIEIFASTN